MEIQNGYIYRVSSIRGGQSVSLEKIQSVSLGGTVVLAYQLDFIEKAVLANSPSPFGGVCGHGPILNGAIRRIDFRLLNILYN